MKPETGETFYGWWIVGSSFLILLITVGVGLYTPPVFLVPLQEHFGWSRAAITGGAGIAALTAGMMSPFVGVLIDRYGARRVMATGALVMGCGFASMGFMRSLWHLYALYVFTAIGVSFCAWIPNQTLISNWFNRKRGLAMGVTLAGIGFGGLSMASLAGFLIARFGWRATFFSLGSLVLFVVVTVVLLVVRSRPSDLGLLPDGDPVAPQEQLGGGLGKDLQTAVTGSLNLSEAIRTNAFWILAFGHILWTFGSMSLIAHVPAFLTDQGFEGTTAANALGMAIGISVVGRISFGMLADRQTKKLILSAALILQALSVVCLLGIHTFGALPGFLVLFGMGLGGGAVLIPLLVGECFGLVAFGKILGLITIPATLGAAAGPVVTGRIFDVTGSYQLAFFLHIASLLAGALVVCFLRQPRTGEV